MKTMKHFVSLFLIVVMLFSLAITVNADTAEPSTISDDSQRLGSYSSPYWDIGLDFLFSYEDKPKYDLTKTGYGYCLAQVVWTYEENSAIVPSKLTPMKYYRLGNDYIIEGRIPIEFEVDHEKEVFMTDLLFNCKLRKSTEYGAFSIRTGMNPSQFISGKKLSLSKTGTSNDSERGELKSWSVKMNGVAVEKTPFTDIESDRWTNWYVSVAYNKNMTTGKSTTTYAPNQPIKRAEFVQMLYKAAGAPKVSGKMPFTDVKKGKYYYDAVLWAYKKGITAGTTATTFGPNESCTNAQIVSFVYAYLGKPQNGSTITFTKKSSLGLSVSGQWISKVSGVSSGKYYYKPVDWLVNSTSWCSTTYAHTPEAFYDVPYKIRFYPSYACTRSFAMFMIVSAIQGK